jgi:hypothetical protein
MMTQLNFTLDFEELKEGIMECMCQLFLDMVITPICQALYFCTLFRLPRYRLLAYISCQVLQN